MSNIVLGKKQSRELAQTFYGDIKNYCQSNFDRYFPFWLNETRKARGRPPLKQRNATSPQSPCCNDCILTNEIRGGYCGEN